MSIRDAIREHLGTGRLRLLKPAIPGVPMEGRTVLASVEVQQVSNPNRLSGDEVHRLAQIRPMLDHFSGGRRITVGVDPRNKNAKAFMARVDPVSDEVWDIRVIDPNPGIRLFGRFSERKVFVALTWNFRENIEGEIGWHAEVQRCRDAWRELFPELPLYGGAKVSDYVGCRYVLV